MNLRPSSFIIGLVVFSIGSATFGQERKAPAPTSRTNTPATKKATGKEISVTESFAPTFSIEPLSHRIEGRSGEVIPFAFKLESNNRDAELEVTPIGLRQELNGQILFDEKATQADAINLLTPSKITLKQNIATSIQGVVKIPKGTARYHSLGIMVKDIGRGPELKPQLNPDGTPKTQAAIRFVTQYVLRLDLVVEGARGEEGSRVVIEEVKMTPFEGRPRFQAMVMNPTDTAFEFELRTRIRSTPSDRSAKPIRLVMPVRSSVQDETRFVGRILPKSRIRMEELVPEAVASGHYYADMEMLVDGQVVNRKTLTLDVRASDFPAQDVLIAQVGQSLQVSPAQIELSQLRGGNRRMTVLLKNNGHDTKTISVKAMTSDELELGILMIQPSEVQLAPGGSRKLSLTLRSQASSEKSADYGYLLVESKSDTKDFVESSKLPLAVLLKKPEATQITLSPLTWDPVSEYPGFKTTVQNLGQAHMPLQARLTIIDTNGRSIAIPSGFGKWLMPGKSTPLNFRLESNLAPGEYQLRCELQQEGEPIRMQQDFTVTDLENAISSK